MTEQERVAYLGACTLSLEHLTYKVEALKSHPWENFDPDDWYIVRRHMLRRYFKRTLDVIQKPKEISDYSESHLKEWRDLVRQLDFITELYFKHHYNKTS